MTAVNVILIIVSFVDVTADDHLRLHNEYFEKIYHTYKVRSSSCKGMSLIPNNQYIYYGYIVSLCYHGSHLFDFVNIKVL